MKVKYLMEQLEKIGIRQYYGVPDSTLNVLCDSLNQAYADRHMTASNEGAAMGMAAGYYLACHQPACVYMQNSGIGNAVNPICSLFHQDVYHIPALLIVGYRGEPGFHDEPQHVFQGKVTLDQLKLLGIECACLNKETSEETLLSLLKQAKAVLDEGRIYALVVSKGTFEKEQTPLKDNGYTLIREEVIAALAEALDDQAVISTTGKISRELYEQLESKKHNHSQAFLTVGSMGHASMIALSFAHERPNQKVICLDGDGACLMHLGSLAAIANHHPENFIHIVLNNAAHESVGGMPTCDPTVNISEIARVLGYASVYRVTTIKDFKEILSKTSNMSGPILIEAMVSLVSRADLGRPKESAIENKMQFMEHFKEGANE